MTDFETRYEELRGEFETVLQNYLATVSLRPQILDESFKYSLMLGGKRVRPVLMLACAKMLGGKTSDVAKLALALEMIHTYSLIHDDLPAMDNDDFRRGQASSHKKFGEGQAILAGDALLNQAFCICLDECKKGRTYLNAVMRIAENAGAEGMIAGQAADLLYQGQSAECTDESEYEFIIRNKTAKMLISAVTVPADVYGTDENTLSLLQEYGKNLGMLFQITDDLLDVNGSFEKLGKTIGKDAEENKLSAIKIYGVEECVKQADRYRDRCLSLLTQLPYECSFMEDFTNFIRVRER